MLALIFSSVAVYYFAVTQDVLESLMDFTLQHEAWELDEFIQF